MRRVVASTVLLGLLLPAPAYAQSDAEAVARALHSDPVYVHPLVADRLTVPERGEVRLEIARTAIGRIKVAVVPQGVAARSGGVHGFANQVDQALRVQGTLIAVAGGSYWAITSYPRSHATAAALQTAVTARANDRLVDELLGAIPQIARIDPGRAGDLERPTSVPTADADDFLDDIGDAFRLGVLIVAVAVSLPFLLGMFLLITRARRRRAHEKEVRETGERSADDELVALGDEIRELDLDTEMPGASRHALAEYEQALARYDQANELLSGSPSEYQVEQARAAIAAGRRHLSAARERLG